MAETFKILSLDGGGIRGLYTAEVLRHFEEAFGGGIGEYFDMICGTSTGGLIALALAKGVPAAEMVSFYKEKGPSIFPSKKYFNKSRGFLKQVFGTGKYDNDPLEAALEEVLGETQMNESRNLLCIPSYNLTTGQPRIFKYPHQEGQNYATKYGSMIEAALATSAAPTYFPVKFLRNCYYTDGGVWANNPVLCGIQEALEYFVGEDKVLQGPNADIAFDSYSILSLGCLPEKNGWEHTGDTKDLNMSAAAWNIKLIDAMSDGQSFAAERLASKLIHMTKAPGQYVRIDGASHLSPAQRRNISLDNASAAAMQALEQVGNTVGDHYRTRAINEVRPFFSQKKNYKTAQ
ncbi:CBASS cGAMP-activated phospholipase [Hymenobacter fodinae]|uniref:Phospholipase n=1 Tax=Hymenobacter fodinae TaxID=2510796 RepID=A0A4Z0NYA2_9BACT|nr:CBASS cGAMP-activated phospholipase [Hymenobacter fodinae]TGE03331.1 phospholipase [Hymenobacter fodinae]